MILGYHIIVAVTVFIAAGLVVTYAMSVSLDNVNPLWCFISYTGNFSVESCIFSLVFSLSSAIYVLIVFLRYVQVYHAIANSQFTEKQLKKMGILNMMSALVGMIGSFGLSITGCFQQRIFHLAHIVGVVLCTYFTLLFVLLQTYFTFVLPPLAAPRPIRILRATVLAFTSVILVCGSAYSVVYLSQSHHRPFDIFESDTFNSHEINYKVGSVVEWILFILNQMFICSLCPDFKKIALKKDQIVIL